MDQPQERERKKRGAKISGRSKEGTIRLIAMLRVEGWPLEDIGEHIGLAMTALTEFVKTPEYKRFVEEFSNKKLQELEKLIKERQSQEIKEYYDRNLLAIKITDEISFKLLEQLQEDDKQVIKQANETAIALKNVTAVRHMNAEQWSILIGIMQKMCIDKPLK